LLLLRLSLGRGNFVMEVSKMKKTKQAGIFLLLFLLLPTCIGGGGLCAESTPTFYAAGYISGNGVNTHSLPCYWQGTELTVLSLPQGADSGSACGIFAGNGRVFAAGNYDNGDVLPCYWEGTKPVLLSLPRVTDSGGVYSILVDGGTVYTAGWYLPLHGIMTRPCYWTGKTPTVPDLPPGAAYGSTSALAVSNGAVYVAGTFAMKFDDDENDPIDETPCYWIGEKFIPLPLPAGITVGFTSSIAVKDGVVYTAGFYKKISRTKGQPYSFFPCYWKGTTLIPLPLSPEAVSGMTDTIRLADDGTVYIIGDFSDKTLKKTIDCYWKGMELSRLQVPEGSSGLSESSIIFKDGKAYIGGLYYQGKSLNKIPCYWVEGDTRSICLQSKKVINGFVYDFVIVMD